MNAAKFFDPRNPIVPKIKEEPFSDRQVQGPGMEDAEQSVIRHQFDYADDEKEAEKDSNSTLFALEIEWNPAKEQVFHIRSGHEQDQSGAEPLFEVFFKLYFHLGHTHALADHKPEKRDRDQAHQDSGEWF